MALAPNTGFTFVNYNLLTNAEAERSVLQGRVNANLDTSAYINMSALLYAFEEPVLGAGFAIGGFLPVGHASLDTSLVGPLASVSAEGSETALGDIAVMPASFYWNTGNWYFNLYGLMPQSPIRS